VGGGHFADEQVMEGRGGPERVDEKVDEVFEAGAGFAVNEHGFGEGSVAEVVAGGAGLTLLRFGSAGFGPVGAGSRDLFFRTGSFFGRFFRIVSCVFLRVHRFRILSKDFAFSFNSFVLLFKKGRASCDWPAAAWFPA
jgi:hypothetical protein